ncbi:hypothetical protein BGX38DRAFT_1175852 [Terfezia claveryi]|nr:hypothetical protein BGX38DRAFT_1175852 [Terfezia claveryi]
MSAIGKTPDSLGCEVCKPALASIFASLLNHHVLSTPHAHLQDTNDKYLGNIQRNGTFSVVPRVAGGEITPDKLIVIGNVAKKYGLYCKITGGQRIDMFGARKQDLVDIWTTLVAAGMESGHAYAKSLRTIKSCVGTTWCRFGVGDSVGLAIRLENRYKSIRSPHKLKSAVSGCVRECAEAQNKDFGLIATDKGYNIYVGGNGGSKPRHGDLLIKDCPPDEVIPILDRYLMFYIRTADRLQRTARWLEALPGGVKYLREVILEDKLGIAKDLEEQMSVLVSTYFCEWAEVVQDQAKQERFRQFANIDPKSASGEALATITPPPESENEKELEARLVRPVDLADNGIEIIQERGQLRPAYWPSGSGTEGIDFRSLTFTGPMSWEPIIHSSKLETSDAAPTTSVAVKRGDTQLAIFHVRGRGYFATQQMCPHKRAFVLSDGLIGDDPSKPGQLWVSCPQHKRNFELAPPTSTTPSSDNSCDPQAMAGGCITDPALSVKMFKVELRDDEMLYIELPSVEELDAVLGTKRWIVKDGEAGEGPFGSLDRKLEKEREERMKGMKGRRGVKVADGGSPPRTSPGKKEDVIVGGGCGVGVDW